MPFTEAWSDYNDGDFVFGLNAAIADFQKTKNVQKSTVDTKVGTVRQLSDKRDGLDKFGVARQEQNTAYLDSLENHPKYQIAYDKNKGGGNVTDNAKFRLKSKAALNWCISSKTIVHFVLDGLDLNEVIEKNFKMPNKPHSPNNEFKSAADDKIRTVTGAELRWIYRNRERPETQECVQFWYAGKQCSPPWSALFKNIVANAPDWGGYKITHPVKI